MAQGIYPISQLPSVKIARHGFFYVSNDCDTSHCHNI